MGWPTDAEIEQAAETLCRLAEIRGLDRGRAVFTPDLQRVEWYEIGEDSGAEIGTVEAHIPSALSYDNRAELVDRCQHEISEGLFSREAESARALPYMFDFAKERGGDPARLRQTASWLSDEVLKREWLERINDEWPPLSMVGEGA